MILKFSKNKKEKYSNRILTRASVYICLNKCKNVVFVASNKNIEKNESYFIRISSYICKEGR